MNDEHTNQTDQHDDQVETLLREASTAIRPDDQTRQAIRARVLVASTDASEGDTSSAAEHNGGRKRRRFAWAASVALIVTGAIVASFALWPSPLTLAAVVEALEDIDWVYIKYDNGEERWRSPNAGVSAWRAPLLGFSADGKTYYDISFWNRRSGEQYRRWARSGFISKSTLEPRDPGPTAWDWLVKPLEEEIQDPTNTNRHQVERHEQNLDARRVVRFDSYTIDVFDQRVLTQQLWADPESRLPIRIRTRTNRKEPDDNPDPGYKNGVFEFPESGPTSIYDLGAARDLPIVDWKSATQTKDEVTTVLDAMRAAERRFPAHYRATYWESSDRDPTDIWVAIFSGNPQVHPPHPQRGFFLDFEGVKGREARYESWSRHPEYHLPLPTTPQQIDKWTGGQTPISLHVSDGDLIFAQRGPHPPVVEIPGAQDITLRVRRIGSMLFRGPGQSRQPRQYQWPFAHRAFVSEFERFEPDPQAPHLIGLHVSYGDTREEYIVDASHDYICIEFSMYEKRGEIWFKTRTNTWGDFERLPSGAWVATSRRLMTPDDPLRGYSGSVTTWSIHIEEIDPDQLPPETFDGDLVLEKAKALGATITTY